MLLLGPNASITADVLRSLRDRDVAQLRIDACDVESISVDDATPIALSPERERQEGIAKASPVRDLLIDRHDDFLSAERTQELADSLILAKAHFEGLREQLSGNVILSTTGFVEIANNYAQAMVDDHEQTVGEVGAATRTCDLDERAIRMFANPVLQNIEGHRIDFELGDSKVLRPVCDPDVDQIRL